MQPDSDSEMARNDMEPSDLEMVRRCAIAMGYKDVHIASGCMGTQYVKCGGIGRVGGVFEFRPLHDDAQAMALVKKLKLNVSFWSDDLWQVGGNGYPAFNADLNRAVVECASKL